MNTNAKGRRTEHKVKDLLERKGYHVIRSAASLGLWDLVAIDSTSVRLVQVRTNRAPRADEWRALREFKTPGAWVFSEVWVWKDRERAPKVYRIEPFHANKLTVWTEPT